MKALKIFMFLISLVSTGVISATEPKVKLSPVSLTALQAKKIQLASNVIFQVPEYLKATDFRQDKQFKPFFRSSFRAKYLTKKPRYLEHYQEGADRLIVTRTLTLNLKKPCQKAFEKGAMPFCFKAKPGKMNKGTSQELDVIRHKISNAKKQGRIGIAEWEPLLTMSDKDMLEFLLNKQTLEKKIIRTSVIPYVAYKMKGLQHQKVHGLHSYTQKGLLTSKIQNNAPPKLNKVNPLSVAAVTSPGIRKVNIPIKSHPKVLTSRTFKPKAPKDPLTFDTNSQFQKNYVMGETFGRSFGDSYEVQFAPSTFFTDRYYAKFKYDITYGFGLRFPFIVQGSSTIDKVYAGENSQVSDYPASELCAEVESINLVSRCARSAQVSIQAKTLDAKTSFYAGAGVHEEQLFNGKEFVLELGATCALYASIPGPNLGPYRCPDSLANLVYESRDFRSQLGERSEDLAELLLPGRELGLAFEAGIGYAALNPGVVLQAEDGVLSVDIDPFGSIPSAQSINFEGGKYNFNVREDVRPGNAQPWGFVMDNPNYRMNAVLVPRIAVEVGIDVGIFDWKTTFGPYDLDSLAINFGRYSFDAHDGVREREQVTVAIRDSLEEGALDKSVYFVAGTNCRDNQLIVKNTLCELESVAVTAQQCSSASFGEQVRIENGNITNLGIPESMRAKVNVVNCNDGYVNVNLDYCNVCTLTFEGNQCKDLSVSSGEKFNFTGNLQWDPLASENTHSCISRNTQMAISQP